MNLPGWSVCGLIGFSLLSAAGQHQACEWWTLLRGLLRRARCWEPDRSEWRISSIKIPISTLKAHWKKWGDARGKSRSCLYGRSSCWMVSMVIAVSSYVLFNLHALERSRVVFIRIVFSWLSHIVLVRDLTLQQRLFLSEVCNLIHSVTQEQKWPAWFRGSELHLLP